MEIGKPGIAVARRVARRKTRGRQWIIAALGPAEQGQPRPGERVGQPASVLKQQREVRIGEQVLGMLGEIRQQQQWARIVLARRCDQRDIGPPAKAGAECRVVLPPHQLAGLGAERRIGDIAHACILTLCSHSLCLPANGHI